MGHPPDVGDERDLLPGPEVLDADLQVLPERPAGETVEIAHDDDEAHVAARGGPLERGQQHVPVVLGGQLPGRLESDDVVRESTQLDDHVLLLSPDRRADRVADQCDALEESRKQRERSLERS